MDLINTIKISSAGMKVQQDRLKVVSQNIANADSVGTRPGEAPYRRQNITFKNELDKETGTQLVRTKKISADNAAFIKKFEPNHPMADQQGYVLYPDINPISEMMDMREARRSYEANLNVIESSKAMLNQTIGLLR